MVLDANWTNTSNASWTNTSSAIWTSALFVSTETRIYFDLFIDQQKDYSLFIDQQKDFNLEF